MSYAVEPRLADAAPVEDIADPLFRKLASERQSESVGAAQHGTALGAVPTAGLLDEIVAILRRYVVLTDEQATALALWVLHTHVLDVAETTPYIAINSAEKQSGKTRLLEVLECIVAEPWFTGRVTSAVLPRKIDADQPTLLLDETDAAFNGPSEYNEALRGILNSGYRRSGSVSLCVGQGKDIRTKDFSTFGAKAFAGIGGLPDTVEDRSISIRLKRRRADERVDKFRLKDAEKLGPLRERIVCWAEQNLDSLRDAEPLMPADLQDRKADVWEPLIAIADLAGEEWGRRARAAAVALSSREETDVTLGVRLLADIRRAFAEQEVDRLSSQALIEVLAWDAEAPWGDWKGSGVSIPPRTLAFLLKPYGIKTSKKVRFGEKTLQGYLRADFEDAWARYLDPQTEHAEHPSDRAQNKQFSNRTHSIEVPVERGESLHYEAVVPDVPPKVADTGTRPLPILGNPEFLPLLRKARSAGQVTDDEFASTVQLHRDLERAAIAGLRP